MGNPFDDRTFLGPQISATQHTKIMGMIEMAKSQGEVLTAGGQSPNGWFIEPTIFRDVQQDMEIMREEVFGPVVAVTPFKDVADVSGKVHDTCYGLAATVFTMNIKQGIRMAKNIEAGTVWVNCYNMLSHQIPFGGYKDSEIGKDLGEATLRKYTNIKSIRIML
jgi:acyl-CoA reductase-like NAD-dependent aldehyde dehydrogenase